MPSLRGRLPTPCSTRDNRWARSCPLTAASAGPGIFFVSESLKSTHVRLSGDAHRALTAIADMEGKDNAEIARLILEERDAPGT